MPWNVAKRQFFVVVQATESEDKTNALNKELAKCEQKHQDMVRHVGIQGNLN